MSRDEVTDYLTHYRAERKSINEMLKAMAGDVGAEYYPQAYSFDKPNVQQQQNVSAMIDGMMERWENANSLQRRIITEARIKTQSLDRILFAVWRLPARQRLVVMATVMGNESITDYARRTNWSKATVTRDRTRALNRLYDVLTHGGIRSWHADDEAQAKQLGAK